MFHRLGEFKKHLVLHEGEGKEQNNGSDVDSDDTEEEEEEEEEERRSKLEKSRGPGSDGNYSDNSESDNEDDFENQNVKDKHTLAENTSEILVLKTVPKKPPGPASQTFLKIPPGPPGPPLSASVPAVQIRPPPGPPPIPRKAISSSSHSAKQGAWYDCCTARLSTHPDFEKPFSRALQERLLATLETPTVALPG